MKNTILVLSVALFYVPIFAQKTEDLGRTIPFSIGLKGTIYEYKIPKGFKDPSEWNYKPEIEKTTPLGYVYTQSLNITERDLSVPFPGVPRRLSSFAIIYEGSFEIQDSGEYFFVLKSDDGSRLWIDGKEIIDHDGEHQFTPKTGTALLSKGFHALKVWYFQGFPDRMGLVLLMKNVKDTTADSWIKALARLLIFNPKSKVIIEGHTDNVGSVASNQKLSESRANAVMEALKKMNVPPSIQFEVKGLGLNQPIAPNNTEGGRLQNRRVEVTIEPL